MWVFKIIIYYKFNKLWDTIHTRFFYPKIGRLQWCVLNNWLTYWNMYKNPKTIIFLHTEWLFWHYQLSQQTIPYILSIKAVNTISAVLLMSNYKTAFCNCMKLDNDVVYSIFRPIGYIHTLPYYYVVLQNHYSLHFYYVHFSVCVQQL